MTPVQVIRSYKLEYSKRLLGTQPKMKPDAVAAEAGFSSASYFVTVFAVLSFAF